MPYWTPPSNGGLALPNSISKNRADPRQQYGVIPYRINDKSEVEVLLITTRETCRWMIPKGWPMKGKSPLEAAAQEALEEAGVEGACDGRIGSFQYLKVLRRKPNQWCRVDVFPMHVDRVRDDWKERFQRDRRWFSLAEAAQVVGEPDLVELLQFLPVKAAEVE